MVQKSILFPTLYFYSGAQLPPLFKGKTLSKVQTWWSFLEAFENKFNSNSFCLSERPTIWNKIAKYSSAFQTIL